MADVTITTDTNVNDLVSLGHTDTDNVYINNGATLTCTETPDTLLGSVIINDGTFLIDGTNITAGNLINVVGEGCLEDSSNDRSIAVNGLGTFKVRGAWFDIGTTDGTVGQSIDLSTTTGVGVWDKDGSDFCIDALTLIQIETGRRINYINESGTTPLIGDIVSKLSDNTVMGKIVGVGVDHLIVNLLTAPLVDGDSICVKKVVDNFGAEYQISWSATTNGVDIKESGVYHEFGNGRGLGVDHTAAFGSGYGGVVFHHAFGGTELTLGKAYLPPIGCNIRIPNVCLNTSEQSEYTLGNAYGNNINPTRSELYEVMSVGGTLDFDVFSSGNSNIAPNYAYVYSASYTGSNNSLGSVGATSTLYLDHCVLCSSPEVRGAAASSAFGNLEDNVNGGVITHCISINPCPNKNSFGGVTSNDCFIYDSIYTSAGQDDYYNNGAVPFNFQGVTNGKIERCLIFLADSTRTGTPNIQNSNNITMLDILYSATQEYTINTNTQYFCYISTSTDVGFYGINPMGGGIHCRYMFNVTDQSGVKFRAIGMIDDKVDLQGTARLPIYINGRVEGVDVARFWTTNHHISYQGLFNLRNHTSNSTFANCSGDDGGGVTPLGYSTRVKGFHGGAGLLGYSNGIGSNYSGSYGFSFHDGFRSDTEGDIICVHITPSPDANETEITAGNPKFLKDGNILWAPGDEIIFRQGYDTLGHISCTGSYSACTSTGNRGNDEFTNFVKEFQYKLSGGVWSDWLDLTVPSNLTSIPDMRSGVRFNIKLKALADYTTTMIIIDTTTSIEAQKNNLYPVDQFESELSLVSLELGSVYRIFDKNDVSHSSGLLIDSPTIVEQIPLAAEGDQVTINYLKYGNKFNSATFVLTEGSTLLFMSQDVNEFVTLSEEDAGNIIGISVDKASKTVTLSGVTQSEIYDYFQWYQSREENVDTLDEEIYTTTDGFVFTSSSSWNFVNSTSNAVYVAISAVDRMDEVVGGTGGLHKYKASFTSIDEWLSDATYGTQLGTVPLDLVANQWELHVELFKDGSPYTTDGNESSKYRLMFAEPNMIQSAAYFMTLSCASGHEHSGVIGEGVQIKRVGSSTWDTTSFCHVEDYAVVSDLSFHFEGNGSGALRAYENGTIRNVIGTERCSIVVKGANLATSGIAVNSLVHDAYYGFPLDTYSNGKFYNCVAMNCTGPGFIVKGYGYELVNCLGINNGTDFNVIKPPTASHLVLTNCASSDTSLASYTSMDNVSSIVPESEIVDTSLRNAHLLNNSSLVGAGADASHVSISDVDGNPWEGTYNIGYDQLGDSLFASFIQLASTELNFGYVVQKADDSLVASGEFTVSPTNLGTPLIAESTSDEIKVTYIKYGNKFNSATFVLTEGSTLLFMSHKTNDNIILTEIEAANLTGITVDKINKTVIISESHTISEVYDYLQYFQSHLDNIDLLQDGEIFNTVLGNNYTLKADWTLIFTANNAGLWNITGDVIINNNITFNTFNITGTLYFDGSGSYTIIDSNIDNVDTLDGDEIVTVEPSGTTAISSNLDSSNITINTPSKSINIEGIPISAEYRIYEKSASQGFIGTEVQGEESWAGGIVSYICSGSGTTLVIQVIANGYEEYTNNVVTTGENQLLTVKLIKDRNL